MVKIVHFMAGKTVGAVEVEGEDRDTVKRAQFLMTGPPTSPHPHFPHFHASAHARKHTATCLFASTSVLLRDEVLAYP